MPIVKFLTPNEPFPDSRSALNTLNGLLAFGGDLSTERLLSAYRQGIFPWFNEGEEIAWFTPEPRMVITPERLHIARSLRKVLPNFEIQVNTDFTAVIQHCAHIPRNKQQGSWINSRMIDAYIRLHQQGYAHSIEAYQDGQLAGGLYGIALGEVFFGESMFAKVSNASKAAFVYLLKQMPYQLVDCQLSSPHLSSLGAFEVTRAEFTKQLAKLTK